MPLMPRRAKGADEVGRIYKKTMEKAAAHEKADAGSWRSARPPREAAKAARPPVATRPTGSPRPTAPPEARWPNDPGLLPRVLAAPLLRGVRPLHPQGARSAGRGYKEVPDWTCCGSTPAHMMDHLLAQSLAARNLRQAAEVGDELLAPCPSCYQREKNAELEIHESDAFRAEVNEMLDKPYTGRVKVYSLPEYLMKFVGEEQDRVSGQDRPLPAQGRALLRLPAGPAGRPGRRVRPRAAHDDGPAAAGRRAPTSSGGTTRPSVAAPAWACPRKRSSASERQGHRAGAGRRGRRHRGVLPALPREPRPEAGRRSTRPWAPTTRCPSCICRRSWASPLA